MAQKPSQKVEFTEVDNIQPQNSKSKKEDKKNAFTVFLALVSYDLVKGVKDAYFNVKQTKTEIVDGKEKTLEVPYPYDVTKLKITDGVLHALSRNVRIFKKAVTLQNEMYEDFQEIFKKDFDFDEDKYNKEEAYRTDFNGKYNEYVNSDKCLEIRKKLWESEFKEEIFTVELSALEACILPDDIFDSLEQLIAKKDSEVEQKPDE